MNIYYISIQQNTPAGGLECTPHVTLCLILINCIFKFNLNYSYLIFKGNVIVTTNL